MPFYMVCSKVLIKWKMGGAQKVLATPLIKSKALKILIFSVESRNYAPPRISPLPTLVVQIPAWVFVSPISPPPHPLAVFSFKCRY